ncbi:NAD(P)-binding protein [Xylariaceae sp. FL0255]|nr:NAD(P)-binding protein [Xylariaceae sp. FL0255]
MFDVSEMPKKTSAVMMRVVIAGGGGFAALLAQELAQSAHSVLVLSRTEHPEFEVNYGCQVAVVDYDHIESLQFILQGADLVISTISGIEQLNLIDAARRVPVRCFVPSEFEGALDDRPRNDPFGNDSSSALTELRRWASPRNNRMKYTVFSCGIFYERFAPGGLAAYGMGATCGLQTQGSYMIDVEHCTAEIPATNSQGRTVRIAMTSAIEVARFVAAAVDLGLDRWPREYKMSGDRLSPQRIVQYCSQVRNVEFAVTERTYEELGAWIAYYEQNQQHANSFSMQHILQTANGRYSFDDTNLNELVDIQPTRFQQWLYGNWTPLQ